MVKLSITVLAGVLNRSVVFSGAVRAHNKVTKFPGKKYIGKKTLIYYDFYLRSCRHYASLLISSSFFFSLWFLF